MQSNTTEMYVWKVMLEVEWEENWLENGKKRYNTWTDTDEYSIASPSGLGAMEKAKSVALHSGRIFDNKDDKEENEPIRTSRPNKVLDITYLELLETLDG